jgi:hypothetical protein
LTEEAAIVDYRLYRFDSENRITGAHDIVADNDRDAQLKALGFSGGLKCELWEGARLVAKMGEDDSQSPV